MATPEERLLALEAQQKEADKDRLERRVLELKKTDIFLRLIEEAEEQDLLWLVLGQVASNAALGYLDTRDRGIEARLDESLKDKGMPLWMSLAIGTLMSFIPVTSLTTQLMGVLTRNTARLMRRTVHASTISRIKMTRSAVRSLTTERRPGERTARYFDRSKGVRNLRRELGQEGKKLRQEIRETEKAVKEFYEKVLPELTNVGQDGLKSALEAAGKFLFPWVDGKETKLKPTTDAPVVVVKKMFEGSITERKGDEMEARKKFRGFVENAYAKATEYIELEPAPAQPKSSYESEIKKRKEDRANARAFIHTMYAIMFGTDEYQPFVPAPPIELPKAEDFEDLQELLELSMWATTFDFTLLTTPHTTIHTNMATFEIPEKFDAIPLPEKMWDILLEKYKDPDTGMPFAQTTNPRTLGTNENPHPSDKVTKQLPYAFPIKWRFSYFLSNVVAQELENEMRGAKDLVPRPLSKPAPKPVVIDAVKMD